MNECKHENPKEICEEIGMTYAGYHYWCSNCGAYQYTEEDKPASDHWEYPKNNKTT